MFTLSHHVKMLWLLIIYPNTLFLLQLWITFFFKRVNECYHITLLRYHITRRCDCANCNDKQHNHPDHESLQCEQEFVPAHQPIPAALDETLGPTKISGTLQSSTKVLPTVVGAGKPARHSEFPNHRWKNFLFPTTTYFSKFVNNTCNFLSKVFNEM